MRTLHASLTTPATTTEPRRDTPCSSTPLQLGIATTPHASRRARPANLHLPRTDSARGPHRYHPASTGEACLKTARRHPGINTPATARRPASHTSALRAHPCRPRVRPSPPHDVILSGARVPQSAPRSSAAGLPTAWPASVWRLPASSAISVSSGVMRNAPVHLLTRPGLTRPLPLNHRSTATVALHRRRTTAATRMATTTLRRLRTTDLHHLRITVRPCNKVRVEDTVMELSETLSDTLAGYGRPPPPPTQQQTFGKRPVPPCM